ncbi:MAG TPA: CPBP family intramembrane glutamic endopeptidase [Symbiobacteriaceae bacterium]|jgi:hypothetical protein|nr:CPBP family intramembrane glutamic endopeptidase [Symbiobacteriaceae bacterium]
MSVSRSRLILTLVCISIPGILLVLLATPAPVIPGVDPTVLRVASAVQSLVMILAAAAIGAFTAPAVGLRTPVLAAWVEGQSPLAILRRSFRPALLAAVVTAFAGIALDLGSRALQPGGVTLEPKLPGVLQLLAGMTYGGIVEEVLVRWGLMSLLVWAGWKLFGRKQQPVAAGFYWTGILLAAVLFGLGHLPVATSLGIALTPLNVAFIISANSVGGILFGWLYWKRGLEIGMMAHALTHVVMFFVNVLLWAVA